ncbi:MAG: T9SS type A sorting domain-containing protein, partial [Fibrobacter sp.]|nr:T9SS type A sorting domain-containing protein [Fibrobacter sp.]
PGWDKYEIVPPPTTGFKNSLRSQNIAASLSVIGKNLQISVPGLNAASANARVVIFDMQGNQVMSRTINGAASINLSGIAAGQYLVKVQGNGFNQNGKILVK